MAGTEKWNASPQCNVDARSHARFPGIALWRWGRIWWKRRPLLSIEQYQVSHVLSQLIWAWQHCIKWGNIFFFMIEVLTYPSLIKVQLTEVLAFDYTVKVSSKDVLDREENHYVISSIQTSCMYCHHAKDKRIQLSKYKDCNGSLQPLQHTKI